MEFKPMSNRALNGSQIEHEGWIYWRLKSSSHERTLGVLVHLWMGWQLSGTRSCLKRAFVSNLILNERCCPQTALLKLRLRELKLRGRMRKRRNSAIYSTGV